MLFLHYQHMGIRKGSLSRQVWKVMAVQPAIEPYVEKNQNHRWGKINRLKK